MLYRLLERTLSNLSWRRRGALGVTIIGLIAAFVPPLDAAQLTGPPDAGGNYAHCNATQSRDVRGSTISGYRIRLKCQVSPTMVFDHFNVEVWDVDTGAKLMDAWIVTESNSGGRYVGISNVNNGSWPGTSGPTDRLRLAAGRLQYGNRVFAVDSWATSPAYPRFPRDYYAGGTAYPDAPTDGPVTSSEQNSSCSPSSPTVQQSVTRMPVNTATGNFWHNFDDLAVAGRGPGLSLTRAYNSLEAGTAGWFGSGWSSTYEMKVTTGSSTATVTQEAGCKITFALQTNGTYTAPGRHRATLVHESNGTWTFVRRAATTFAFDSTGRLTALSDVNGNTTTVAYPSSTSTVVTDADGRTLTFTVASGRVTSVADATTPSRSLTYSYDTNSRLVDVVDVDGGHTVFTYDSSGRMLTMRFPRFYGDTTTTPSPVITNHYDTAGRIDWQSDELARTTSFDYTTAAGSTIVTFPSGNKTKYRYDHGILTAETRGYGSSIPSMWTYDFDPATTSTVSMVEPTGGMYSYTYDSHGNRLTAVDPLGRQTSATYNSLDLPLTTTDAKGVTTTFTYDTAGHLLTASTPWVEGGTGAVRASQLAYDTVHPEDVATVTDPDGKVWTSTYDAAGNPTASADPLGNTGLTCFDDVGRPIASVVASAEANGVDCSTTAPAAGTSYATYSASGRVLTATDPAGHTSTRTYDANGNTATATDANSNTTSYTYDAAGQLVETERADTTSVTTDYTADGLVSHQYDAAGEATTYTYDAQGRTTTVADALSRTTTYAYDTSGRVVSQQNPGGNCAATPATSCIKFTRNIAGEVTAITYPTGTPNVADITYDANGRRTAMTDGSGTWTFIYDSLGRLTRSQQVLSSVTTRVDYGYNRRGLLTSIAYPNSTGTVTRSYDDAGRFTSLTNWLTQTTTFAYDADNNLIGDERPNSTDGIYTYDTTGALDTISYAPHTNHAQPFSTFDYDRDDVGLVTSVATAGSPTDDHTWTYDTLNRISTDSASTTAFGFDAADNLAQTSSGNTQVFDDAHQLCWTAAAPATGACSSPPTGATTYTYATTGNRTSDITPTGTRTYGYDTANRLTSFAKTGTTAAYSYNADGLRTSKTVNTVATKYAWDLSGSLPLLLTEGTTSYVYGPSSAPIEKITGTTVTRYHHDHLGTVRTATNSTGAVAATYNYDAHGKPTTSTGTLTTAFGFAGEYRDTESGLTYLRARYYDPTTGQFLNRDPIEALTRDAYSYAANNPLNNIDPSGLNWLSDRASDAGGFVVEHRKGIAQGLAIAAVVVAGVAIAPAGAAAVTAGLSSIASSAGASGTAGMLAAEIGSFTAISNGLAATSFGLSATSTYLACQDGWTTSCKISLASTAGGGFLSGIGAFSRPLLALGASIGSFYASLAGTHSPEEADALRASRCSSK